MKTLIEKFLAFYNRKNRFWIPILAGLFFCFGVPPFNSFLHPAFTFFPLLCFIICIPLFLFATQKPLKRAFMHSYLFGIFASAGQFYWIAFVVPEGLWHLVLLGVLLITLVEGLFFVIMAIGFRFIFRQFPRFYPLVFAALWVLVEYLRSLGEISFPWNLVGYTLTPLLPIAQFASVTGVFGLSFIIILGNAIVLSCLIRIRSSTRQTAALPLFIAACVAITVWGFVRLHTAQQDRSHQVKIALLQGNIDQNHWGNNSLDASFDNIGGLVKQAAIDKPDLIVMPESALLCYLVRQQQLRQRVLDWSKTYKIPMLVGALHWDPAPSESAEQYRVYNTAFYLDTASDYFHRYFKIMLVPFSEALPFKGIFPVLSRVNLGQADFTRGNDLTVFSVGKNIKAAPFICYEVIYPAFVRERVKHGANLFVNMTNDGWFGKSSGAYQHATMARMRCIENGVALARCANSGISMFVDAYGHVISRTELYTRTVLTGSVSCAKVKTLYARFGDWPVWFSVIILGFAGGLWVIRERIKN